MVSKSRKKSAKSVGSLKPKNLTAKQARAVKGGTTENVSLSFAKVNVEYKPQKG